MGTTKKTREKLTKTLVDAAEPPDRKPGEDDESYAKRWAWLGDLEVPGFGVKVYGSGRKMYAVRYRTTTGRQRMVTLGQHGELTVKQARTKAAAEKVRILDGEDPQAEKQRQAVEIGTVSKLLTQWVEDYAKAHRKRWEGDEARIDRHIRPKLGKLALEDVTPDVLASWHRTIGKKAKVEANRCLETLRAAWRWAHGGGLIADDLPDDPTKRVKKFRERGRDRWLRKEEVQRLMEATAKQTDPYVRAAVPLFLLTGLRKSELLGAKWEHVDLDRAELRLPETKTGEAQVRLLPAPAVRILRELPLTEGSPYVFPSPKDKTKPRDDIKNPWAEIREKAKLEDITLHDLRRTAGSHMAQAGVPLQVIGEVLGHSHPGVTKLYARLASDNARDALDTLSDALSGVLGLDGGQDDTEDAPDLPRQLVALVEATKDDPEAFRAGLRALGLGEAVEA